MTTDSKATLNARVKIAAGPAAGSFGRVSSIDTHTWRADIALDDGRTARSVPLKHVELIAEEKITDREKLLDRIRKMQAKADSLSAMGPEYEAEALTFAASVAKMLAKYRLTLDDLQMSTIEQDEPVGEGYTRTASKEKYGEWVEVLAQVVARAHFCRVFVSKNAFYLTGREIDRQVAGFMISTLQRAALELSDKNARTFRKNLRRVEGATTARNQNYRSAWLVGFVERIAERYREEERAMEKEQSSTGGKSLVLVRKDALAAVDKYLDDKYNRAVEEARARRDALQTTDEPSKPARKTKTPRYREPKERNVPGSSAAHVGREHGRAAADSVNIRGTGLGEAARSTTRSLRDSD